MKETVAALDSVLSNCIGLLADIPGMLRSSRMWIFLATAAVAYYTATQAGLHGTDAALAVIAEVVLGTGTIIGKTIRSGAPAVAVATAATTAVAATNAEAAVLQAEAPQPAVTTTTTAQPSGSAPLYDGNTGIISTDPQQEKVTVTPAPQLVVTPFYKEDFMAKVDEKLIEHYGVRNSCTIFYEAQNVLSTWTIDNKQAWINAREFMAFLAEAAFKEVWECSYDEALVKVKEPDKNNCTYPSLKYKAMQYGIAHYAILLELERYR
jgi:hypothetical protein